MNLKEFFKECHEKEVFKNLSIYVVSSWVLIQVFSVIWEPFGLPKISMTYLLLVLIIGFPFYVYLLWRYRLNPLESKLSRREELKISQKMAGSKEGIQGLKKRKIHLPGVHFYSPFQKMYFTSLFVITLVAIFSASVIVKANFINEPDASAFAFALEEDNPKIAVLNFDNSTSDKELDVVGKMAVDWIIHGITQNDLGQVISPKIVEEYTTLFRASLVPGRDNAVLTDYLKPGRVISGTYYLNEGKLLMQSSILDGDMNKTINSFEAVVCDPDTPLICIDELKQRIMGYLLEGKSGTFYEDTPPKYEAYKLVIEALSNYDKSGQKYLEALNEAITLDSTYFEPKLHRVAYYYNKDEFAIADSLITLWSREPGNEKRQKNLVKIWEALLKGDNRKAFNYHRKEYNSEPDDINNNMSTMVLALQFVNRPEAVDSIYYQQRVLDKVDMNNCQECEYRYYVKGLADIELGNPEKLIEMYRDYGSMKGFTWVKDVLIRAYVKTRNKKAVADIMSTEKLTGDLALWRKKSLFTAKEYLREGDTETAEVYLDQLLGSLEEQSTPLLKEEKEWMGHAYFYKGEYQKAEREFRSLFIEYPEDIACKNYLAMSLFKNGKEEEANKLMESMESQRKNYQYGAIDYAKARYHALAGNQDQMIQNLIRAVSAGKRFTPDAYQHDILMKPYVQSEAFKKVLSFWH